MAEPRSPEHRTTPMRRTRLALQGWLLSVRDMLTSAGPVLLLAAGLLVGAYVWLDPQPPRSVTLATGPAGSAYAEFGQRYAQALKQDGIRVELLHTDGPAASLQALRDGDADVAFVRGGSSQAGDADAANNNDADAGIMSLGALFYEPLWVFYRPGAVNVASAKGGS